MIFGIDYTVLVVVLGAAVVGLLSAAMGSFLYVRRESLFADLVSHSSLPGVALSAVLISGMNFLFLVICAMISALGITSGVDYLRNRLKIDPGTLFAVAITTSFGLGIIIISHAQKLGIATGGLERFLLGQVAAITMEQVGIMVALTVFVLAMTGLFYRQLQLISFDPTFARTIGVPIGHISLLFTVLLTITIATGISVVGAILMVALMVSPALIARPWCKRFKSLVASSAVVGFVGALIGSGISFFDPRIPTGAAIVLVLVATAIVSLTCRLLYLRRTREVEG
ncbi:MAG: metal ABC transporter permease [Fimbriimonadaceae bacterium]